MHNPFAVIAAAVIVTLVQVAFFLFDLSPPILGTDGLLFGPDSYMRLVKVGELIAGGGWYDAMSGAHNAPIGVSYAWSRSLDIVLIVLAAPFMVFMDTGDALFGAGVISGPVLQIIMVMTLSWATRPFVGTGAFLLLVLLLALQPNIYNAYMIARPDHHGLQLLLFAAGFFSLLRVATDRSSPEMATFAGIAIGAAMWVSVEALLFLLAASVAFGLLWVWQGGEHWRTMRRIFWGALAAITIAMMVERPPGDWTIPEYDKLSVVHWTLLAAMATAWSVLERTAQGTRKTATRRLLMGVIGGLIVLAVMAMVFPKFFSGPFVDVDPRIMDLWFSKISEMQPLFPHDGMSAGKLIALFGPMVYVVWYAAGQFRSGASGERAGAVFYLVVTMMYFGFVLYQIRWGTYGVVLMVMPWAALAARCWHGPIGAGNRISARVMAAVFIISGPILIGGAIMTVTKQTPEKEPSLTADCRWSTIVDPLQARASDAGHRLIILSFIHQGSEIIYRTGQRVVGTPYHRNYQGILDTDDILSAPDDETAGAIIRQRGVDYIALCKGSKDARQYQDGETEIETFYQRLENGRLPAWLKPVPLPGDATGNLMVFRIIEGDF